MSGMGRASARKRPAARQTPATATTPTGPVLPRSVKAMTPAQSRLFERLQWAELDRRKASELVDKRVVEGRAAGMPWSVLAYAIGVSSQAVAKKYGDRV